MPKKLLTYCILSGILLSLPLYPLFPGVILLGALLPMLFVDDFFYRQKKYYPSKSIFLYASLTFLTWHILTLWWMAKVTWIGAMYAITLGTLSYALVFWLAHIVKRKLGNRIGQIALVSIWISFEYWSLNNEISIPWLILGNGFAHNTKIIQWYEYTGTLGGSTWVLISNILLFEMIQNIKARESKKAGIIMAITVIWIFVPIFTSIKIYQTPEKKTSSYNVAIIQPNIDPYTEKFNTLSQKEQLDIILHLADSAANSSIDYFIAPETAIDDNIWELSLFNNFSLYRIREFIRKYPKSKFVLGAITYHEYQNSEQWTVSTRFDSTDNAYYDAFNSVIQLDNSMAAQIYHKSKLVIGVEKTPLLKYSRFFEKHFLKFGGISGSLGQDNKQDILFSNDSLVRIAPIICYESVFGEYVNKNIKKGANLIFVITNDGWLNSTSGYWQHFNYSVLRAIETRRWIARCGNTGISGIISSKGEIVKASDWWKRTIITGKVSINMRKTFYVLNGDYIGRGALLFTICIFMIYILVLFKK